MPLLLKTTVSSCSLQYIEKMRIGRCKLQYAGKKIRFAELAVEFYQRKPIKTLRFLPFILFFDSEGSIDAKEMQKERRLAMEAHPLYHEEEAIPNVIDARHYFARKRYDHEYRWEISEKIADAILKSLFG